MLTGFSHVLELGNKMFHETWLHHEGSDFMDTLSLAGNNKTNAGKTFQVKHWILLLQVGSNGIQMHPEYDHKYDYNKIST